MISLKSFERKVRNNLNGGNLTNIILVNRYKFKFSVDVNFVNGTVDFDRMLSRLEGEANNNEIYILEWSKDDFFFFFVPTVLMI